MSHTNELKPQQEPESIPCAEKIAPAALAYLQIIKNRYQQLAPEQQVVVGALVSYIYIVLLTSPHALPYAAQPLIEALYTLPSAKVSLYSSLLVAMIGTTDGIRRIAVERIPLYKAYVLVYLLGKPANLGEPPSNRD